MKRRATGAQRGEMRRGWKRFEDERGNKSCSVKYTAVESRPMMAITSLKCNKQMPKIKEKRGWMIGTTRATEDNEKKTRQTTEWQVEGAKMMIDKEGKHLTKNGARPCCPFIQAITERQESLSHSILQSAVSRSAKMAKKQRQMLWIKRKQKQRMRMSFRLRL